MSLVPLIPTPSQLDALEQRVRRLEKRLELVEEWVKQMAPPDLPPASDKEPNGYL